MKSQIRPAFTIFILLVFLTGLFYPFMVTGIAQVAFPAEANGSIIDNNGDLVGSVLIGQDFSDPRYFWGRPSATSSSPYSSFDSLTLIGSTGSNLGPLSQTLVDDVQQRVKALQAAGPGNPLPLPIDLVTTSASGLDPHISLAAAYYQIARVSRTRGLAETIVRSLVDRYSTLRTFGFLGEPRVNVLLLNLALDGVK